MKIFLLTGDMNLALLKMILQEMSKYVKIKAILCFFGPAKREDGKHSTQRNDSPGEGH